MLCWQHWSSSLRDHSQQLGRCGNSCALGARRTAYIDELATQVSALLAVLRLATPEQQLASSQSAVGSLHAQLRTANNDELATQRSALLAALATMKRQLVTSQSAGVKLHAQLQQLATS